MLEDSHPFSGISVDDIDEAAAFYGDVLGFGVERSMGGISVALPDETHLWVYPKPDHVPATFTVLNFAVSDIDRAVDDLNAAGVSTTIYDDPSLPTDAKGVMRGLAAGRGPDIAWFRDPAGNVLAVLQGPDD